MRLLANILFIQQRLVLPLVCFLLGFLTVPVFGQSPPQPSVYITLTDRDGNAHPVRCGHALTGGGTINVTQPTPDTIVVTLNGVAAASSQPFTQSSAAMKIVLDQCFQVRFADPKVKFAKLAMGVRVNGLLRNERGEGSAQLEEAFAALRANGSDILAVSIPPKSLCSLPKQERRCRHGLAVSASRGPVCVVVPEGKFTLHQTFGISVQRNKGCLPWRSSAEFAPPPCLPASWVGYGDPFGGVDKTNFGFQVVLKVSPGQTPTQPTTGAQK